MNIPVTQVQKGDYVPNFGYVDKVRVFYRDSAVERKVGAMNRKFVPIPDNTARARLIAEQQENLYEQVVDTVVVYCGSVSRSFRAESNVDVYRSNSAAA